MEELNKTESVSVIAEDDFDVLSVVDMGDAISLSQVSEDGDLHSVVIGREQAEELVKKLRGFLA